MLPVVTMETLCALGLKLTSQHKSIRQNHNNPTTTPTNINTRINSQNHSKKYINQTSTSTINPRGCLATHYNPQIHQIHVYYNKNREGNKKKKVKFRDTKQIEGGKFLKTLLQGCRRSSRS